MDNRERHSLKNPEETANFLSSLFFGWIFPIFWKGARRSLETKDLYDPSEANESDRLGDRLEKEWKEELARADKEFVLGKDGKKTKSRKPSLAMALTRMFWFPYMGQGVLILIQVTTFFVMQPVFQGWVIGYFNTTNNLTSKEEVLLYAGLMILSTLGGVFIQHHTNLRCQELGMRARVACCSLIYRKILRLDQAAVSSTAAGQVANLISNDVARFDTVPMFLHRIWIMLVQVGLIGYLMWRSVGIAALAGIGTMLLQSVPIQGYMSKLSADLRSKIAVKTDERVQLMSELISGIQVVKMYAWEKPFDLIVSKVRAVEMKLIGYTTYLRGFYLSIMVFSERVTLYLTLITFVLMGNSLTAESTFVLASLFNILQLSCAIYFPQAIIMAGEAAVSLDRLTEFLLMDEIQRPGKATLNQTEGLKGVNKVSAGPQVESGVRVELNKVAANWVHGQLPPTLCEVSIEVKSRSLCAVVGPVASGKSSLLHLLLDELTVGAGRLSLYAGENNETKINNRDIRVSYSSQDPWLFSGSIRENILFGQPFDAERYKEVTKVCALLKDFEQLPQGDLSFVGERGASLSGGQRARVNLARAVYRDAELYLLDDPLSAVDTHVGRHLFDECITGFLKNKTRILVTHQLQYLPEADNIVVLNRGTVERQGTYETLAKSGFHFSLENKSEEPDEFDDTEDKSHTKTAAVPTHDEHVQSPETDGEGYMDVHEEQIEKGAMSNEVYWGYFRAGGNACVLALLVTIMVLAQMATSGTDYWISYWTNEETMRAALRMDDSTAEHKMQHSSDTNKSFNWNGLQWSDETGLVVTHTAIYVYTFCILCCIVMVSLRNMLFMKISMNASRNIHNSMFENLLRATMRFFNTNPAGRVLNRFSKDVGSMDELLPKAFMEALQIFSVMTGILTMVAVVNPWMMVLMVVLGGLFQMIRKYYLKTAQNIKRLEGITKSPVFSHVSSTLDGLTTIRSRGIEAENMLQKEFDQHQDAHTSAWYLTIASAVAFGFTLDLISCSFIACVCYSFILMDDGHTLGGSVGLAISQSLILTGMVQHGIRQSTDVISQMTSVERVLQYTNLPKEGPFTTEKPPPPTWPAKGALSFKNVHMRYAKDKPAVLKNLNMAINAGWKVGIVGRTGAGKSSLISALFRLTGDSLEGEIALDGINTNSIGLHELRPRISIIPQEPILFSASLRYNLDPFNEYSDAELWNSLREVELGDAVPSLDFKVAGGGANFSVGQRQLICLARAILRNNRVLVLDEATANIDRGTDSLIQNTIRRRFADCTVLTIAHRLNTIMDSDRVLVMAGGQAVEFGHPHLLLKNRGGFFFQMIQQTGKAMAENLARIAENAFLEGAEFENELNNDATLSDLKITTHL